MKNFIATTQASGGGDEPEDVQGGFQRAIELKWEKASVKSIFHIFDAAGHGKDIYDGAHDNHPKGSPDGYKLQD